MLTLIFLKKSLLEFCSESLWPSVLSVGRVFIIASISSGFVGLFQCLSALDFSLVGDMHQQIYPFPFGFLIAGLLSNGLPMSDIWHAQRDHEL